MDDPVHLPRSSYTDASADVALSRTALTPPLPRGDLLPLVLSRAAWGWSEPASPAGAGSEVTGKAEGPVWMLPRTRTSVGALQCRLRDALEVSGPAAP